MARENCIFCKIVRGESPSYKVYENDRVIAFFDISLGNDFHTLVVPKKHYKDIFDIDNETLSEIIKVTKKICRTYKMELNIGNINLVQSNGTYAGQEVFHYHMHILPREKDDGNTLKFNNDINNQERLSANFSRIKDLFI